MKSLLRNTLINSLGLYATTLIIQGIIISGGFVTFLFSGLILSILTFFVRPVLGLITLPLSMVTFGLFSFLINALILYLLTIFVPDIKINSFIFNGINFYGFIIPKIAFNTFFVYVLAAFVLSFIISFQKWLIK